MLCQWDIYWTPTVRLLGLDCHLKGQIPQSVNVCPRLYTHNYNLQSEPHENYAAAPITDVDGMYQISLHYIKSFGSCLCGTGQPSIWWFPYIPFKTWYDPFSCFKKHWSQIQKSIMLNPWFCFLTSSKKVKRIYSIAVWKLPKSIKRKKMLCYLG